MRRFAAYQRAGSYDPWIFAEIKHHRNPCYRRKTAPASGPCLMSLGASAKHKLLSTSCPGGGERLARRDADALSDLTYLLLPRPFLIVDRLPHERPRETRPEKIRSFELARRHPQEPEILIFDDLRARAEWIVNNSVGGWFSLS